MTIETRCCQIIFEFQRYPPKDFCTARYEHKSSGGKKKRKKTKRKHILYSALTSIISKMSTKYYIRWCLLPQQEGLAWDTHRAECALSTAPIRKGVNAKATAYAKLGGWDGQYFSCNPLFLCLARLEQSDDRVGIRYAKHHNPWNHHSSCDCCNFSVFDFIRIVFFCANTNHLK